MAEFRKLFYALGFTAMLAGVSSTASAQTTICTQIATPAPIIREESFAELVGEFALDCSGGLPTAAGTDVPRVNITVSLSTNITSKILATATAGNWSEALLIIDDPNSPSHPATPLLACGQTGAPDNSIAGLGVCSIIAGANPDLTYNGATNVTGTFTCDGVDPDGTGPQPARPTTTGFGCGHPNVYQGRQGVAQVTGNTNSIAFVGVPFDPPGPTVADNPLTDLVNEARTGHRILRITNIRANSPPVSGGFLFQTVIMEVNINANSISVTNTTRTVASVNRGLLAPVVNSALFGAAGNFVQCRARTTDNTTANPQPLSIRFREGFPSSFKPKSLEQILANSGGNTLGLGSTRFYDGSSTSYGTGGVRQNVPGIVYNSESGFTAPSSYTNNSPNPPVGFNFGADVTVASGAAFIANSTGITNAGIATQGTRIAVTFRDIPNGTTVQAPSVVFLYPAGTSTNPTGVAVRTAVASARGDGPYSPLGTGLFAVTGDLIVYEVLYAEAAAIEDLLIPINESHNLQSLASDLPEVNKTAQVSGGFAPFILGTDSANVWGQAQRTLNQAGGDAATVGNVLFTNYLPVPRFRPGSGFIDLFRISKCACNLLFPFVTNAASTGGNYDTGIAIANTSLTPGAAATASQRFGFRNGTSQEGPVQFWYYPANATDPPVATQCTNTTATGVCPGTTAVKAGETLLYVLSQNSSRWGLKGAPGFTGYMIAQANFQYCHAFAYIAPQGATPLTNGMSVGYLALSLDGNSNLNSRTNQDAEGLIH